MGQEYKLRRRLGRDGTPAHGTIGVPQWVLESYVVGQTFVWQQLASGQLVATPVRVVQPPGTAA